MRNPRQGGRIFKKMDVDLSNFSPLKIFADGGPGGN
jgi:hypothetical protein